MSSAVKMAEPAGGVEEGKTAAVVLSGGNVDAGLFARVLRGEI